MNRRKGITPPGVQAKSKRLRDGLLIRERTLRQYIKRFEDEEGLASTTFIPRATKKSLREWHEPEKGIYRVSVNTFNKDNPLAERLLSLTDQLHRKIEAHTETKTKSTNDKDLKRTDWKRKYQQEKARTQTLTDDLMTLRGAYIDLLHELDSSDRQSKSLREAIQRHYKMHGLNPAHATGNE